MQHRMVAAATMLAAAAATLLAGCGDEPARGGPIERGMPHGWAISKAVGEEFTDGMETIEVKGDQPVYIDSVDLVGGDGLEIVGVRLVTPDRPFGAIQVIHAWPPADPELDPGHIREVDGTAVTPSGEHGWELLLGLKAVDDGYLVREGIRINYTVDGEQFTQVLPAELAVCTSPKYEKDGRCPFPDEL